MPRATATLQSLGLLPRAGRPASGEPVFARRGRDLTPRDLDILRNPPPIGLPAKRLSQIKHAHHQLARLLAEGRRAVECSAITGYTQTTISLLRDDPMFNELVEHYKQEVNEKYLNVHERLANVGVTALEEIQRRLNEGPLDFTNRELVETLNSVFDRSVAPAKGPARGGQPDGGSSNVKLVVQFVEPKSRPGDNVTLDLEASRS